MRSRECPGEPFVPRTPTFKDLLRSRVHEVKQKEETQPLENEREGGEREERESAEDTKRRTHARLVRPQGPERIYWAKAPAGIGGEAGSGVQSSCETRRLLIPDEDFIDQISIFYNKSENHAFDPHFFENLHVALPNV